MSSGPSPSCGSGGSGGGVGQDFDGLFRDAYASGHPENFIAANYKNYGFSKSTGLSSEYKKKYGDDFTDALTETKRRVDEAEYSPQATIAYLRAQGYDDDMIQRILDQVG